MPDGPGCTSTGSGGSSGTGGVAGTGGGTGVGGTAGAGGASFGQPACPATVTKGGACASTDVPLCYKTCGPEKTGVKSDTCTGGVYAEMSGCLFDPTRDYSCYKLPSTSIAACGTDVPIAGSACNVAACQICNSTEGLRGGGYARFGGRGEDRLLRLPGAEFSRDTHLELRQRHRLAVPGRRGLLTLVRLRRSAGALHDIKSDVRNLP